MSWSQPRESDDLKMRDPDGGWTMPGESVPIGFPRQRPRRLRGSERLRRMVRETQVTTDDLVYPMFVAHGTGLKREIPSMPGNFHWSVDRLPAEVEAIAALGIPAVLLFGLPEAK